MKKKSGAPQRTMASMAGILGNDWAGTKDTVAWRIGKGCK